MPSELARRYRRGSDAGGETASVTYIADAGAVRICFSPCAGVVEYEIRSIPVDSIEYARQVIEAEHAHMGLVGWEEVTSEDGKAKPEQSG